MLYFYRKTHLAAETVYISVIKIRKKLELEAVLINSSPRQEAVFMSFCSWDRQRFKSTTESNINMLNPLSPDMKMHILLTVLHTFLMELVRRICLNIKTLDLILGDHFLHSQHLNVKKNSDDVGRNFIFVTVGLKG